MFYGMLFTERHSLDVGILWYIKSNKGFTTVLDMYIATELMLTKTILLDGETVPRALKPTDKI